MDQLALQGPRVLEEAPASPVLTDQQDQADQLDRTD